MKLALVQQMSGPDIESNTVRGLQALREAASQGADLVAYPELAFQRFFPQFRRHECEEPRAETIPGPTTRMFQEEAQRLGVVVVLNLYERDGDQYFDSSPVIDSDGTLLGVTRMVHIMQGQCYFERDFYTPGDRGAPVYETKLGQIGVAICYDRHYPEYMRALGLSGAQLVLVPQAGAIDEWPPGLFEAELQVASMQNGYFCALANRVGSEDRLEFSGESFVTDPRGQVIARAERGVERILYADVDFGEIEGCPARLHFLSDRRPEIYPLSGSKL